MASVVRSLETQDSSDLTLLAWEQRICESACPWPFGPLACASHTVPQDPRSQVPGERVTLNQKQMNSTSRHTPTRSGNWCLGHRQLKGSSHAASGVFGVSALQAVPLNPHPAGSSLGADQTRHSQLCPASCGTDFKS